MFYIDLPSYDDTIIVHKGKYYVKVYEWRVPTYSELDVMLFDSNDNLINKYDYNTYYYKDGTWHDMPVNEWGSNYHKWHFDPDVRIYKVAVELNGFSWY